jgi:hypothetical protein
MVMVPGKSGVTPAVAIVIDNCFVLLPAELDALTVNVDVPAVAGVPEITPAAESVKPVGNVPPVTLHEKGVVPVAVTV